LDHVVKAPCEVNEDTSQVHDHVSGGSAHIPKIQKLLWDFLSDNLGSEKKYKAGRLEAKQSFSEELLQTAAFTMKTDMEVEHQSKSNNHDKQIILDKSNENINLDKNHTAEKEEFAHQEVEKV
ncbi:Heat shock cognate 71 kDa protein, partial [Camelus dromedarius]